MFVPEHGAQAVRDDRPHHGHGETLEEDIRDDGDELHTGSGQAGGNVSNVFDDPHVILATELQLAGDQRHHRHHHQLGWKGIPEANLSVTLG